VDGAQGEYPTRLNNEQAQEMMDQMMKDEEELMEMESTVFSKAWTSIPWPIRLCIALAGIAVQVYCIYTLLTLEMQSDAAAAAKMPQAAVA